MYVIILLDDPTDELQDCFAVHWAVIPEETKDSFIGSDLNNLANFSLYSGYVFFNCLCTSCLKP